MQLLLDVDSTLAFSSTRSLPLLLAANNNSVRGVEVLLRHSAQVNSQDNHGRTALFWAAVNDSEEMARLLLGKAADVNLADQYGATPLHIALECSSEKVLEVLVGHGASLSARTKPPEDRFVCNSPTQTSKCSATGGSTPLHVAVLNTQSPQIVRSLLDAGADIDPKNDHGDTPLSVAMDTASSQSNSEEMSITRILLSRGASLDTRNNEGDTLLMKAAQVRNLETMQWLLDNHAAVSTQDNKGQ